MGLQVRGEERRGEVQLRPTADLRVETKNCFCSGRTEVAGLAWTELAGSIPVLCSLRETSTGRE